MEDNGDADAVWGAGVGGKGEMARAAGAQQRI
jgi:hypothetical protein